MMSTILLLVLPEPWAAEYLGQQGPWAACHGLALHLSHKVTFLLLCPLGSALNSFYWWCYPTIL